MRPNIFLDLDGVMADLEGHYVGCFGHKMDEAPSRSQMWKNIHNHKNFWATIPVMEGGHIFLKDLIRMVHPIILTAAPPTERYHTIAEHKKQWVHDNLGDNLFVIPTYGSESKPLFLQQHGDILIDDWGKNCRAWEAVGGIAIQHSGIDFDATYQKLLEALDAADDARKRKRA